MPELPPRPHLDHLRHEARRLVRAARAGDPDALRRINAVSERVSLSAAQLAVARQYGWRSWSALRHDIAVLGELRGAQASPALQNEEGIGGIPSGVWWGPASVTIGCGALSLDPLIGWSARGDLHATITEDVAFQSTEIQRVLADLEVVDAIGTNYDPAHCTALGPGGLNAWLQPAPPREAAWVELRGVHGTTCRMLRGPTADATIGAPRAARETPAQRGVEVLARLLLRKRLFPPWRKVAPYMGQLCDRALAQAKEIIASGDPAETRLLGDLRALCLVLCTPGSPTTGVPKRWASVLDAAGLEDGLCLNLNVSMKLPAPTGTHLALGALVSTPSRWKLTVSASPTWWRYDETPEELSARFEVAAEDDRGGHYHAVPVSEALHGTYEDITINFRPRLDPLAETVRVFLDNGSTIRTVGIRLT